MFKKKTSKYAYLGGIVVIVLIAIGFYFAGQNSAENQTLSLPGKLEIKESKYNFGTIGLDNVSHSFMAKNIGEGPLTIERVATSCGCTSAQLVKNGQASIKFGMDHGTLPMANMTLKPGEEVEIIATYSPLAHGPQNAAGYFNRVVYVKTDNPKEEHELIITMTVDPALGKN